MELFRPSALQTSSFVETQERDADRANTDVDQEHEIFEKKINAPKREIVQNKPADQRD